MNYQERKAVRRASFVAEQGKPQPRRVIRVYAVQVLDVLPARFDTLPVGVFSSWREAEEFIRDVGPGTMWGSQAMKALSTMMTREEKRRVPPGYTSYVGFFPVSEIV